MLSSVPVFVALAGLVSTASAHAALWHKSMYGFNVTDKTFSYDNRPQVPLYGMTFDQWWMHGHIDYPPHPGDFFELPAGGKVNTEISCDKGATSWYPTSEGGDVGYGDNFACPGAQPSAIHTTGLDDVKGCALGIAYQSDVHALKPEDFTIFSVNHTCVWYLNTEFEVPQLPACPEDGCHCAWFWVHSIDSGSQQIYMNGFKCKITGNVGTQILGKPAVPRRCGTDPHQEGADVAHPGNCTVGAKQPIYWYQKERNNLFEGTYQAPYYNDLYGFHDGAQNDIFYDGQIASTANFNLPSTSQIATHVAVVSSVASEITSTKAPAKTTTPAPPKESPAASSTSQETHDSSPTASESSPTSSSTSSGSSRQCKRNGKNKKRSQKRSHARHLGAAGHH
ncbi:hypothetical protein C8Q74DRAFT_1366521 [Fomes fomentarius]|nr:hypothetical protein C8Q74DRAFT_1366521 [Fomes fomentarius]